MERPQWPCMPGVLQDPPGQPQLFDSLFIRVQRHQGYSAFDRSEHVFTSAEASGMMLWMTPW